jgi:precorrin-6A synthase
MRNILLIGIGAGDPEQITVQAINAMNRVDVFFMVDKGEAKQGLGQLREEILDRYISEHTYRVVHGSDPERDRTSPTYVAAVDDWRSQRAALYLRMIGEELGADETGAFLIWGDPTLYDSTIGILANLHSRGEVPFDYEVIPGISSVSALAARHRTALNQIGRPVQITTGRRLAQAWPAEVDDVVVMLDARNAFTGYTGEDIDIYWGAYVGTPDEILLSGRLFEVAPRIEAERAQARERKGWIMDSYLLRRQAGDDSR